MRSKCMINPLLLSMCIAPFAAAQAEFSAAPATADNPDYLPAASMPTPMQRDAQFAAAMQALSQGPRARYIVRLNVPGYEYFRDASIAAHGADGAAADAVLANAIQAAGQQLAAELSPGSFDVDAELRGIPAIILHVNADALARLEKSPLVAGIETEEWFSPDLNQTAQIVTATTVWQTGHEGSNWYVAVLDTGIRATHEAFSGKNIVQACFSTACPNGTDIDTTSPDAARHRAAPYDSDHGTHVAGIATGNDPAGITQYDGIARSANIIAIQVFSPSTCDGQPCVQASNADIVRAMDHVYSLRNTYKIASINLSLGGGAYDNQGVCDSYSSSFITAATNLRSVGIATVVSAGNDSHCDQVSWPGCASPVVGVGSTNNNDEVSSFSNHNATLIEVFAPGENVHAPIGSGDHDYGDKSGTSMAAPHVAGAFALIREIAPQATVSEIVAALQASGASVTMNCSGGTPVKRIDIFLALHYLLDVNARWVQFGYSGPQAGFWYAPYGIIDLALTTVPTGGTIWFYPGARPGQLTINRAMKLRCNGGVVRLGGF